MATPRVRGAPGARVESYGPASVDVDSLLEQTNHVTAVFSYPILMDRSHGNRAVNRPRKRATRTFVAEDYWGDILLGNTEGGFFSLRRLGDFLRNADTLDLKTALNLDGGPPACMAIRAGAYEFVSYGAWESAPTAAGVETVIFNDKNRRRWPIPIVISVR